MPVIWWNVQGRCLSRLMFSRIARVEVEADCGGEQFVAEEFSHKRPRRAVFAGEFLPRR
jgi:hypothetical protein